MKYIDTDLLRKEIKRRRLHFNKEAEKYQALNNGYSHNCYGARDALRDLENFLDTLSEEPDKSLEEEIRKYFQGYFPGTETVEQCNTDLHFTPPAIIRLARHFAQWGKEQMLKDAVEGRVFMSFAPGHNQMVMADVDLPTNTKVRIVVLKEEEQI